MDVGLDAEQQAFARTAAKIAREISHEWDAGRSPEDTDSCAPSDDTWRTIVDAGWFAMRLDEESGGAGGSVVDVCVLAEQLGYHAVPVPVIGTIIALEQLQLRGADPSFLESVAAGETRLTTAFTPDLRDFAAPDDASAVAFDTAGLHTAVVLGGEAVEIALPGFETGADLTRGLTRLSSLTPDVRHKLAEATPESHDRALAFALTLVSADMLGIMRGSLDAAVEHARIREQFGVPIGSFQALQHLAAEALVSVEATRSAVWYAAWGVDELPADEALEAARTTKAFASASVIEVVETVIQIFGGIGMTWESPAHIWQRRAHLDRRILGDEDHQYVLLAERQGRSTTEA